MDRDLSLVQLIEFFHLAFLEVFQVRFDRRRSVLKGGANLRFFHGSPRFSEDMDFDATEIDRWKLEEKVDGVLSSRPLVLTLRTQGLTIRASTKPKQTTTTQRWKITLQGSGRSEPIRTKIEFSHRKADDRCQVDHIPEEVVAPYALRPPTVNHYLAPAMIEQKISALVGRVETQVRDVFDLDLLFRQAQAVPEKTASEHLKIAMTRVRELPYSSYRSLVVRFLNPDVIELYDHPEFWKQMQDRVISRLAALR